MAAPSISDASASAPTKPHSSRCPFSSGRFDRIDASQFCPGGVGYPFEQMHAKLLYRTLRRGGRRVLHRR
jgi:hypothetical protein